MRSELYCDECIARDFAVIAEDKVWSYGTVRRLVEWQRTELKCKLCWLIWNALDFEDEYDDEDIQGMLDWEIKLGRRHKRSTKLFPEKESLAIPVFAIAPGRLSSFSDKILSRAPTWFIDAFTDFRESQLAAGSLAVKLAGQNGSSSIAPPVQPHGRDERCFDRIRGWLNECVQKHGNGCNSVRESILPRRVLDVSHIKGTDFVRLIDTELPDAPQRGVYAALSYSWGREKFKVTNSSNIKDHVEAISVRECPQTIQDAIQVTRRLGITYLWVDSLCIIQGADDLARKDFEREAPKMNHIYSQAFVTIMAANTTQASEPFLKSRSDQLEEWVLLDREKYFSHDQADFYQSGAIFICLETFSKDFTAWPTTVDSRAWCLQEKVLSQRILSYHDQGLVFACRQMWATETIQRPWSSNAYFSKISFGKGWKKQFWAGFRLLFDDAELSRGIVSKERYQHALWTSMISHYCARNITRQSDRLVAIAGIAQVWQELFESCYLAGIWSSDIHTQLLWRHTGREENGEIEFRLSNPRRCPSWSWAYLDGKVEFHWNLSGLAGSREYTGSTVLKELCGSKLTWVSQKIHPDGLGIWNGSYLLVEAQTRQCSEDLQAEYKYLKEEHGTYFDSGVPPVGQTLHYVEIVNYQTEERTNGRPIHLSSGLVLVEVETKALTEILTYTEKTPDTKDEMQNKGVPRDDRGRKMAHKGVAQVYTSTGILDLEFVQKRDSNLPQFVRVGVYRGLDVFSVEGCVGRKILIR